MKDKLLGKLLIVSASKLPPAQCSQLVSHAVVTVKLPVRVETSRLALPRFSAMVYGYLSILWSRPDGRHGYKMACTYGSERRAAIAGHPQPLHSILSSILLSPTMIE
jgi:hypothetical protein